jgi:hypothetical protein
MPMSPAVWMLMLHAGATCAMAGVIWFVQVVHYPLFAYVGGGGFTAFHSAHARLTTLVVGPLMVVEAVTAVWLLWLRPAGVPASLLWTGVLLVALLWATTFLLAVPRHAGLAGGFDAAVHAELVAINWVRAIAWTARAAVAVVILFEAAVALGTRAA